MNHLNISAKEVGNALLNHMQCLEKKQETIATKNIFQRSQTIIFKRFEY